ncbi:MAG: hypothetical protein RQ767_04660 [Thermovirgaceae bacterium]|nr:hypothetical protein [Thermovirgaceae bacterium]
MRARRRSCGDGARADTPAGNRCAGGDRRGDRVGTIGGRYDKGANVPCLPSFQGKNMADSALRRKSGGWSDCGGIHEGVRSKEQGWGLFL